MKAVRLRAFIPLEIDSEDAVRVGWCAPGNPLDLDLAQQKVIFNQYLTLGLRIDKWRIPRPLFRAHYEAAAQELLARSGKDKLSKKERDELKFRIERRLRKKVLPSMRAFDLLWDLDRRAVVFWNRSPRAKEELMAHFERTFSLRLDEASPYVVAKELLAEKRLPELLQLKPTSLLDAASEKRT